MIVSFTKEDFRKFASPETFEKIVDVRTVPALLSHMKQYADLPAVKEADGTAVTYAKLLADVWATAAFLKAKGAGRGDHIGVFCPNGYLFAVAALGAMANGCTAVLIPAHLDEKTLFGFSRKYALKGLLYADALKEKIALLDPATLLLSDVPAACAAPAGEEAVDYEIGEDQPACIIMTGGTSGKSKGAVLSHVALTGGVLNGCYGIDAVFGQTYYCIMPLTHVFGFIRNLLTAFYSGSSIAFNADKMKMFDEIRACRPTVLVIVPALAELFLNLIKAYGAGMLGGAVKLIVCGAANVPPYLSTEYSKLGILFCAGYGLTEFANMVSGNPETVSLPESVGMLFPDQEGKIVNGELYLRGRNMMTCYYADPEETEAAFEDGWFKTGDLARFDENKNLFIIGRSKDVIVLSNGENVSPAYIEAKIDELDFIQDALVTETESELGAEILQAEVVLRKSVVAAMKIPPEELNDFVVKSVLAVNDKLLDYEHISKVVIRDKDFDRTPAMKIIRPKKVYGK